jgi:hypothetical protein
MRGSAEDFMVNLKSSENHRMIIFPLSEDHLISSYYQLNVTLRSSDGHLAIILTTYLQLFYIF